MAPRGLLLATLWSSPSSELVSMLYGSNQVPASHTYIHVLRASPSLSLSLVPFSGPSLLLSPTAAAHPATFFLLLRLKSRNSHVHSGMKSTGKLDSSFRHYSRVCRHVRGVEAHMRELDAPGKERGIFPPTRRGRKRKTRRRRWRREKMADIRTRVVSRGYIFICLRSLCRFRALLGRSSRARSSRECVCAGI